MTGVFRSGSPPKNASTNFSGLIVSRAADPAHHVLRGFERHLLGEEVVMPWSPAGSIAREVH